MGILKRIIVGALVTVAPFYIGFLVIMALIGSIKLVIGLFLLGSVAYALFFASRFFGTKRDDQEDI